MVKHEALAINRSRRRIVGFAEVDLDALESRTSASPEEHVLGAERVARSAEALHGLKPQEVRALWLKALGHSYEQICEVTGWTYTKVTGSVISASPSGVRLIGPSHAGSSPGSSSRPPGIPSDRMLAP